ncbi:PQQ-binding-like beta-propeller repeat protein [Planctomycetota bacterium]
MSIIITLIATSCLYAGDWLGFHGLEKQGRCDSLTGPVTWSSSQNVLWKTAIPGRGHSSPIVSGDHVYVTTTYESVHFSQSIGSYIIFILALVFAIAGIGFVIQDLRLRKSNTQNMWQHVRFFLLIQFFLGIILVALFGRNLLRLEGDATRSLSAAIIFMLSCLAVFLYSRKYRSTRNSSDDNEGPKQTTQRHFVLTVGIALVIALTAFLLFLYRASGYQMPDRYFWDDRMKPEVGWWCIGLYALAVLITFSSCCWKSLRDVMAKRFPFQKVFFLASLLLGVTFFIRSGLLKQSKEFIHAVVCVNRDSGKVLWTGEGLLGRTELQRSRTVTYASATPVSDGERIYGYFGADGLMCVNAEGKLLWKETEPLFDSKYGAATSPVVKDNVLIIVSDVRESATLPSSITAFDCVSGEPLWKKLRESHKDYATYGTPLVSSMNGRKVVMAHGWQDVKGYDLETGDELWSYPIVHNGHHLVASLVSDTERLYVIGAREIRAFDLLKLETADYPLVWSRPVRGEKSPTPVVVNGLMFLVTESGIAICLDAETGAIQWEKRLGGRYYSSVITMANKVFFTNESGKTKIVPADGEFRILAENTLNEPVYASLVPTGDKLFIRTDRHIYCIQEGK